MIQWFGKENGYSDAEIRSIIWRITSLRAREKEKTTRPAEKLVKAKKTLKKAA